MRLVPWSRKRLESLSSARGSSVSSSSSSSSPSHVQVHRLGAWSGGDMRAASGEGVLWHVRDGGLFRGAKRAGDKFEWRSVGGGAPVTAVCARAGEAVSGDEAGRVSHLGEEGVEESVVVGGGGVVAVCVGKRRVFAALEDGGVVAIEEKFGGWKVVEEAGGASCGCLCVDDWFLYGGRDGGVVRLWDLESFDLVRELDVASVGIASLMRAGPSSLWMGLEDGRVRVLDVFGDEDSGIEVVAEEKAHVGAVDGLLRIGCDEIWSFASEDSSDAAVWSVCLPELKNERSEACGGGGPGALLEVSRETFEKVTLAKVYASSAVVCSSVVVTHDGRAQMSYSAEPLALSPSGKENAYGSGRRHAMSGWRQNTNPEALKPVTDALQRANEAAVNILRVRDTMDPAALDELLSSVEKFYCEANFELRRVAAKPYLSPGRTADMKKSGARADLESSFSSEDGGGVVSKLDFDVDANSAEGKTSEQGNAPDAEEKHPELPLLSPAVTETLHVSLQRARSFLPSVRIGDKQGPLAQEMDNALVLLELCISDYGKRCEVSGSPKRGSPGSALRQEALVAVAKETYLLREDLEKSRQEHAAAMVGLRDTKAQLLLAREAGDAAARSRTTAEAERDVLAQDLDDLQNESERTVDSLTRALQEQTSRSDTLKSEMKEVGARLRAEGKDRADLELKLDEKLDVIESLERARRDAGNALLEKITELAGHENVLDERREDVENLRALIMEHEEEKRDMEVASESLSRQLLDATAQLETSFEKVSELKRDLERSEKEVEKWRNDRDMLQSVLDAERLLLFTAQTESRDALAAAEQAQETASKAREDFQEAEKKRRAAEEVAEKQIPILNELTQAVSKRLEIDSAESDAEISRLSASSEVLSRQLSAALRQVASLEETESNLLSSLADSNSSLANLEGELSMTESELQASTEECTLLRQAAKAQRAELDAGKSSFDHLMQAMEALRIDHEESLRIQDTQSRRHVLSVSAVDAVTPPTSPTGGDFDVLLSEKDIEIEALKRTNESCDEELRELREALRIRDIALSKTRGKLAEVESDRTATQESLNVQIETTSALGGMLADKDERLTALEKHLEKLERGVIDPAVTSRQGSTTFTEAMDVLEDSRHATEIVTSIATRLRDIASTHREALPILVELERELRRQNAKTSAENLAPAIECLGHMISLMYTDEEKSSFAVAGGDDASYFNASPSRQSHLRSQVASWRALRNSSSGFIDNVARDAGASEIPAMASDEEDMSDGEKEDEHWTPRRFLQF